MKKFIIGIICSTLAFLGFSFRETAEALTGETFLIVNKATNKMAYYEKGVKVKEFNVATGKYSSYTPEGTFTIVKKIVKPTYYRTNIKGGDPRNPLGPRWIGFDARNTNGNTYGVHGTNDERSIGKYASSGCIRMYNKEVIWLYDRIPAKSKIMIVNSKKSFDELAKSMKEDISPKESIHIVKKGDTLYRISKSYGTSVEKIMKLNGLKNTSIKIGQKIKIK